MRDIDNRLFLEYKEFIEKNVTFNTKILPKAPQSLVEFPTIVFKQQNNIDYTRANTVDRLEYADDLTFQIEIYTKNMIIDGKTTASKVIMDELRYLTTYFFQVRGFNRTLCEPAEYLDVTVDRLIILERCQINNWNGIIS